ncbi:amidohydrolase family protein [Luteimicrobium subarcticum]|uniref:Guanine deaminase n=1 Tax=Luteimicrobium subarcticum TaxID=620910 RepID=A0A2M8W1B1_9MICO|nr:amidohydrolase family protein [Luteimicrobium subarcticum]PJI84717.1 guanine deaminase [Luteimicrobium subarcticum]
MQQKSGPGPVDGPVDGLVVEGHVLHVSGSPAPPEVHDALVSLPDGAVAVDGSGRVGWVGHRADLPAEHAARPRRRTGFVLPGFVDTHLHLAQTYSVDAYGGGQLLDWLERCIFPAEARLQDPEVADRIATDFCEQRVAAGTTSAMVFGSAFLHAQDALFSQSLEHGLRTVSGRGIQTVGPDSAKPLLTSEDAVSGLARVEIERWHGVDPRPGTAERDAMLQVALVPRFALSVTPRTLDALGDLYADVSRRGVYVHTHLSENDGGPWGECAAVREQFGVARYLDAYDGGHHGPDVPRRPGLLGRRSVFAHGVHCEDGELARLAETGSSIAHCPTSQLFLGSGTMPWRRTAASGVHVALASDVGAGDEWLLPRVASDCFKVHMSEQGEAGVAIEPAELLFLATLAGSRALDQEHLTGNLDVGKEADLVLVDPDRQPTLARALRHGVRSDDPVEATAQTLFTLLLGMREASIEAVYVRGRKVSA